MIDLRCLLKTFDSPTEVREFLHGRFELVQIADLTIGRATYQPGWKWSEHVGPALGLERCTVEHVGLGLQGVATVAFEDGRVVALSPGTLFHVSAAPDDTWVVGDQTYVSLHFLNPSDYAVQPAAER